jgi:hypothetical protein
MNRPGTTACRAARSLPVALISSCFFRDPGAFDVLIAKLVVGEN